MLQCHSTIFGRFIIKAFSRTVKIEAWVETVKEDLQAAAREVVRQTLGRSAISKPNLSPLSNSSKKESINSPIKEESNLNFQPKKQLPNRYEPHLNRPVLTIQSEGVQELFENYNKLLSK